MNPSFNVSSMLSLPDRALTIKLFYKNGEYTTVVMRKFRTEERLKYWKSLILLDGILKLVRRFEEIGNLKDPYLERGPRTCCTLNIWWPRHQLEVAVFVKLGKEWGFLKDQFYLFCMESWNCIRTKFRHFTSYYSQTQKQPLLNGSWIEWNLTHSFCWESYWRMKPTFHCMVR